jgi:hypothetical protein
VTQDALGHASKHHPLERPEAPGADHDQADVGCRGRADQGVDGPTSTRRSTLLTTPAKGAAAFARACSTPRSKPPAPSLVMPTSRPSSSTTGYPLTPCSTVSRAALWMGVVGRTVITSRVMSSAKLCTISASAQGAKERAERLDDRPRMRPIRMDGAPRLVTLDDHLSRDTRYHRFFSVMRRLPPDWARFLADVDYEQRLALVIESPEDPDTLMRGVVELSFTARPARSSGR